MKLYHNQIEILDILVDDTSVRYRSIMQDDSLTLNFSTVEPVDVPIGAYCEFEGQRYTLYYPENFKKHNTRNFEYTLVLHGSQEALKLYKFKDLSAKPYRLKFPLTATAEVFLQLLVDNMNEHDAGWSSGDCIVADDKLISFNHEYCYDVLNRIATEFNTEWEIENKTIHLRKVEKFKSDPLALSYGKGNGFKSGVGRTNEGDRQPIGRLYVQGGERNIDYSTYSSPTLLLPKSAMLTHDDKTYRTDADGMYITRDGNNNPAEDSYDGSDIYPKRVGTVTDVIVVDEEKNFYDIVDSSIPELLNYGDCRIAGEKATIVFQSGALAGREFDIQQTDSALTGYDHEERKFQIVPAELDGFVMPGGVFVPQVGDKYAIFNISMPEAYISDDATQSGASWDMFREAVRYFAENEEPRFSFRGELDGVWSRNKWLEIGGKIVPGGYILFSDTQFQPSGVKIRITSIKDYVNMPHKPEITLSNAPISMSFASDLGKIEAEEVVRESDKKEIIHYTKRRWRDTLETMSLLEKSLLHFDKGINPITVQTMQLLVGDESLQFRFVNNKTNPQVVTHSVTFDSESKTLNAPAGIIQHMTLGINTLKKNHDASEYKFWDVGNYDSPPLDPEEPYYLYARVSRTGTTGHFLLSDAAIGMEDDNEAYHLLVGILNSEFEGERSFVTLYGFTEILPGRVTTDKIVSNDGKTYFDLIQGIIGGNIRFLSNGAETSLDSWASQLKSDLAGLDNQIGDFEDYINGAFKDGVIDAAEAKAIEKYINTIQAEKASIEATYNKIYVNPLLSGTAKTNLLNSKITYFGDVDALINRINQVIADGKVTTAEKQQVDNAFATYSASYALFSQRIQEANQAIQSAWGSALQANIDGLDNQIGEFEDYVDGAFKDGVISEAEAKAIESYINIIQSEKASIEATYNKLFVNPLLSGTAKTNLLNAKVSYLGDVDSLISRINQVIADGKVTASEKQQVDNAFATYRASYALFSQRIQEANQAIQSEIGNNASEALASANLARAITDKFGTTIDGGLIATVMMLLREANTDIVTAGVSGIQGKNKNHPAFWAGGTSEKAIALIEFLQKMAAGITPGSQEYENLAKIVMLHNGAAKVGDLIIEDSGRVVIIDPLTAVSRLILGATSLPTISNLISGSNFSGGVNLSAAQTSSTTQLAQSLNITYDMSLCTLSAMSISVTGSGRAYQGGMSSFAECILWAKKDGVRYTSLNSARVYFLSLNDTVEYEVYNAPSKTFHLPKGYYTFELEVRKAGLASSASGNIGASSLNWTFSYNVRRLQFGTDGFMAYFNNNHIHFTEGGGLDVRGKTNMPGVLASGTVSAAGTQSNVWGPKSNSSCNHTSTGVYRIYHNIGHTQYNAVATPHESNVASVEVRASTYIDVRIVLRGNGNVANKPFDYIIVGKNYA